MKRSLAETLARREIKPRMEGFRVGTIVEVDENGKVWVDFPGNSERPVQARLAGEFRLKKLKRVVATGEEVLIAFENFDPGLPIILDVICDDANHITKGDEIALQTKDLDEIRVDGKRMAIEAQEEIILRCGKASITLTRAGKVLIRGAYIHNRSSGAIRIKGGSIQLN